MATHIHIEGMHTYNGDYPLDVSSFSNRELHTIKQISGLRAGELEDGFDADDNDLIVAMTVIALQRAGVKVDMNVIWDAPVGKVSLVIEDEQEDDASPPASPPPSEPAASESSSEKPRSSGAGFTNGGDPLAIRRSPTGSQPSATGATSGSVT